MAYRRNEWRTLYNGTFVQEKFDVDEKFLE